MVDSRIKLKLLLFCLTGKLDTVVKGPPSLGARGHHRRDILDLVWAMAPIIERDATRLMDEL